MLWWPVKQNSWALQYVMVSIFLSHLVYNGILKRLCIESIPVSYPECRTHLLATEKRSIKFNEMNESSTL